MNKEKMELIRIIFDSNVEGNSIEKIKAILDEKQERELPSSWEELPALRSLLMVNQHITPVKIKTSPRHSKIQKRYYH